MTESNNFLVTKQVVKCNFFHQAFLGTGNFISNLKVIMTTDVKYASMIIWHLSRVDLTEVLNMLNTLANRTYTVWLLN